MTEPPCAQEMTVGTPRPAPPAHPPAENSGAGPGGGNGSDWAWGAYVRGDPGDAGGEGGGSAWGGGAAAAAAKASSAGRVETLPMWGLCACLYLCVLKARHTGERADASREAERKRQMRSAVVFFPVTPTHLSLSSSSLAVWCPPPFHTRPGVAHTPHTATHTPPMAAPNPQAAALAAALAKLARAAVGLGLGASALQSSLYTGEC